MKHILKNWTFHGDMGKTQLLAETFPRSRVHFLIGEKDDVRTAVVADLAVALASTSATCGLSPAAEDGSRASLSGWFGLDAGTAVGVAIVANQGRSEALRRAVTAHALARSVASPLPIAFAEVRHIIDAPRLLHDLGPWLAERGVELSVVILDGFEGADQRTLQAIQSNGSAVLVVASELPVAMGRESSVVVEVGPNRIDVTPAGGEPWARKCSFERVILPSGPELALVVGAAIPAVSRPARPAVAAPIVNEPSPLPPITSRAAHLISRGRTDPDIETRWRSAGYILLRNPENGLSDLPHHGRREIVVAGIGDQRAEDILSAANQLRQTAMARGLSDRVVIRVGRENELPSAA